MLVSYFVSSTSIRNLINVGTSNANIWVPENKYWLLSIINTIIIKRENNGFFLIENEYNNIFEFNCEINKTF